MRITAIALALNSLGYDTNYFGLLRAKRDGIITDNEFAICKNALGIINPHVFVFSR
jgi:hypothetical protein